MAYDSLLGYLDGTLRYPKAASTLYVASIKNHPDFLKLGFCQLSFRYRRMADPLIESFIYQSCQNAEVQLMCGDIPRRTIFLIEQYLHSQLTPYREVIPELEEIAWSGRYETYRIPRHSRTDFVSWVDSEFSYLASTGQTAEELMLDALVCCAEERLLFEDLKDRWERERASRLRTIEQKDRRYARLG